MSTDVFEAVQRGDALLGVVPLENSTNGAVVPTLEVLADRLQTNSDIHVCGAIYLDVHHYLVGHLPRGSANSRATADNVSTACPVELAEPLASVTQKVASYSISSPSPSPSPWSGSTSASVLPSRSLTISPDSGSSSDSGARTPTPGDPNPQPLAQPVTDLSHLKRIYSHPQAFGQCNIFLGSHVPKGVDMLETSSTSKAAELVNAAGVDDMSVAAITSDVAAAAYGLDILASRIEDRPDNTTRFIVLSKGPREVHLGNPPLPPVSSRAKTMVSFTVPHTSSNALAMALDSFRLAGLDLTSIHTRPKLPPQPTQLDQSQPPQPFQYVFFIEFVGHRLRDENGQIESALQLLDLVAPNWRWLGSWDDQC